MSRTVLVRGFAAATTKRDILALFAPYSGALSARLVRARGAHTSPRKCFVRMRSDEEAGRAARDLDGREYQGHALRMDVFDRQAPERSNDGSAARNLFLSTAPPLDAAPADAAAPADVGTLAISFVVGARAFEYLDSRAGLEPSTRVAVDTARERGRIAATYYFIDLGDDVVRDIRDVLRGRSGRADADGRACDAAASAIESRRRLAWHLTPCPQCGGSLGPTSWLTPAVFLLSCKTCGWRIPG